MNSICKKELCTGCQACVQACPLHCIAMERDELDALYPCIDLSKCKKCGICRKVCPAINNRELHDTRDVYVGWSSDYETRKNAASGGVASEFYKYYISHRGYTLGVVLDRENGAFYRPLTSIEELKQAKNSKYVYSDVRNSFQIIRRKLQDGIQVLFIGLPCQVAGLLSFLGQDYDNLVTVDIICHGVAPWPYLKQHISYWERKKNFISSCIFFRDPDFGTINYRFTLRDNNHICYQSAVIGKDTYQLGFHFSLIYRENCYSCKYAQPKRVGDLSIGDFEGLGRFEPWDFSVKDYSCILVNSKKGAELLDRMGTALVLQKRDTREAFQVEPLLNAPSKYHSKRDVFVKQYKETGNFEKSARMGLRDEIWKYNVSVLKNTHIYKGMCRIKCRAKCFLNKVLKRIIRTMR